MKTNLEVIFTTNEYNTIQKLREYYLNDKIINSAFENFGEFINLVSYPMFKNNEGYPLLVKVKD